MRKKSGGPCSHCKSTSSFEWRKDPVDKRRILCNPCYARVTQTGTLQGYLPVSLRSPHASSGESLQESGSTEADVTSDRRLDPFLVGAQGPGAESNDDSDDNEELQSASGEESEERPTRSAEHARHAIFAHTFDAFPDISTEAVAGDADEDILWDDPEFDVMVQSLPDSTVRNTQVSA